MTWPFQRSWTVQPARPISPPNLSQMPLPSTSSNTRPFAELLPVGGLEGGGGGGGGGTGAGGAGGGTGAGHLLAWAAATAAAPCWLLPFWPACGVFLHLLAAL